ncbi:MAG TPA: hypothetical protein VFA69_03740 [Candidatus Nitrosotalea sp.]|nr:hypothetical protein [Candidatus Nitrosotalea sp.]
MNSGKRIAIIGGIIASVIVAIFVDSMNANMFEQTRISQDSIQHISTPNLKAGIKK